MRCDSLREIETRLLFFGCCSLLLSISPFYFYSIYLLTQSLWQRARMHRNPPSSTEAPFAARPLPSPTLLSIAPEACCRPWCFPSFSSSLFSFIIPFETLAAFDDDCRRDRRRRCNLADSHADVKRGINISALNRWRSSPRLSSNG